MILTTRLSATGTGRACCALRPVTSILAGMVADIGLVLGGAGVKES